MTTKGRLSAQGLDENVIDAFRENVRERYGKLHTVFGQQLQIAMEQYLDRNSTHTHESEQEKFMQKAEKKSIGVIRLENAEQAIQTAGLLAAISGGGVYPEAVKTVLKRSVGLDERTITKYFDAFCAKNNFTIEQSGALGCL
jgi:hypothetical protein